ncbi:MAG: hypothetical protein UT19_C0016G0020 [Candidatus Woesebacteria bacterium GW2011_GWB1_39_10b]|uniref:FG-GAP repeat protein n=1 Tax=Candidatus Woesebacteria bacterium GW2011_GWB1_39_10b TaxID=1618573 RepID=A0A0G0LQ76_9BACT|nr:MAG: hypothetical protein UT19_C0016G0020 [Candidatus Woesebacteria bacterium GW2011_GWB1_39_10b]
MSSTSTGLTTGNLGLFDWSPSNWATASGDLVRINIGPLGDITGNLFNITDNGSTLFRVASNQIESAVPHAFTSAGDASFSYDAIFINQTSSQIETYGPFSIVVGESFENNDLTLTTYGTGDVVINPSGTGELVISAADPTIIFDTTTTTDTDFWVGVVEDAGGDDDDYFRIGDGTTPGSNVFLTLDTSGKLGIGDSTPDALLDVDGSVTGHALVEINDTDTDQNLFVASSSGTTRFIIQNDGDIDVYGTAIGLNNDADVDNLIGVSAAGSDPSGNLFWGNRTVCDSSGNCAGTTNYWQRALGVIAPGNAGSITDDLAIGGAATSSASFQAFGIETTGGNVAKLTSDTITTGDVLSATASAITSGNLLKLGQGGNSAFSGNVIYADVDRTGGDTFTGNFLKFDNAASTVFSVNSGGAIAIDPTTTGTFLDFELDTQWTAGDLINADWAGARTQTAALTGINLDFTNLTSVAGSTTYGLLINDLAAQTSSTEYAIYQEGVNWDFGGYFEDDLATLNNLYVGATTETLDNTGFVIDGDDAFVAGMMGVEGNVYTDGSFIAGTTLTLSDSAIAESGDLNLQPDADTDDYFYLDTTTNIPGLFWETGMTTNDAGFRISASDDTGQLQYRDQNSATWVSFDNFGLASSDYWQLNSQQLAPANITYDLLVGGTATSSASFMAYGLFDWSPSSWATASGDLVRINLGQYGDTTGNLFAIYDNSSELFSVDTAKITSALPHEFTAAGDVTIAYDLVFTNQTASNIKSYGPLTIESGESFENNNLTLKTYGTGDIIFDPGITGSVVVGATASATLRFHVSDDEISTASAMIENVNTSTDADALAVKLAFTSGVGSGCDTGGSCNEYITFLRGDGLKVGKIHAASTTSVTYKGNGTDFAEYFVKIPGYTPSAGDVIEIDPSTSTVKPASGEYNPRLIGVVSSSPVFVGGVEGPDKVLVGLVGQIPVKVASYSEPIRAGDFLTSSNLTGLAVKSNRAGHAVGKALESWEPNSGRDKVLAYIDPAWHDPDVRLTKLSGLTDFLVDNIKAGYVEVNQLISDQLISKFVKTDRLETKEITSSDGNLAIKLNEASPSGFGKLLVQNRAGETVFGVDESGNATASGELASQSLKTNDASIAGTLKADRIVANEIVGLDAETNQSLINQSSDWDLNTSMGSAALNELALENLYVTGSAAINSLSVTESVVIGSDLVLSSQINELTGQQINSLDTVNAPLSIQSSASQPLYLMASLVQIDTQGNVQIAGNLTVGGTIESSGLRLTGSYPANEEPNGFGKLLSIANDRGEEVAVITATGAAKLASLETDKISISDDPAATSSASFAGIVYTTSASAGSARIPQGSREVIIRNPKITKDSLVFVTPTSSTLNPLFIKEQVEGEIKVGFDIPANSDVTFNWWLVELAKQAAAE